LQLRSDRVAFRPYGLSGGHEGGPSRNTIEIDGEVQPIPAKVTMSVKHGALIVHEQAGGGGFGDPATRAPDLVREDLRDGKITPAYARRFHGFDG
jgi:N-methylhydantoinase B